MQSLDLISAPKQQNSMSQVITKDSFLNLIKIYTNLDCNYTFPVDLAPNGCLSGAKSIEKW